LPDGIVLLVAAQGSSIGAHPEPKDEVDRWLLATWAFIALSTFAKAFTGYSFQSLHFLAPLG
jgi:hypothetical protein